MLCPKCRSEYRAAYTRCSVCDLPLVAELPAESRPVRKNLQLSRNAVRLLWAFATVTIATALVVFGYRFQHRPIFEARYVPIGGIDQWVQVHGFDRTNPVLLWLHGGPGASTIPETAAYSEWEKEFTLVMWDQRGAGKTLEKYGSSIADSLSIQQMVADGLELAAYLRDHLNTKKIIVMGHSWGSILGIHMASEQPELFSAYVGVGQFTDLKRAMLSSYPKLLKRAEENNRTQTALGLRAIGPPPYRDRPENYRVLVGVANVLDPPVPQLDESKWLATRSQNLADGRTAQPDIEELLFPSILQEDLTASATSFQIPIIFIDGSEDLVTPNAKDYFDLIRAPSKEFIPIPGFGHFAIFRAPDRVLEQLIQALSKVKE